MGDRTGVVHQGSDTPQFDVNAIEQADHLILDAHIGPHRNGLRALGPDLFENVLGSVFIGLVIDADSIAQVGRQQRRGCPDPAPATGDDDDFIHACSPVPRKHVGPKNSVDPTICTTRPAYRGGGTP